MSFSSETKKELSSINSNNIDKDPTMLPNISLFILTLSFNILLVPYNSKKSIPKLRSKSPSK